MQRIAPQLLPLYCWSLMLLASAQDASPAMVSERRPDWVPSQLAPPGSLRVLSSEPRCLAPRGDRCLLGEWSRSLLRAAELFSSSAFFDGLDGLSLDMLAAMNARSSVVMVFTFALRAPTVLSSVVSPAVSVPTVPSRFLSSCAWPASSADLDFGVAGAGFFVKEPGTF